MSGFNNNESSPNYITPIPSDVESYNWDDGLQDKINTMYRVVFSVILSLTLLGVVANVLVLYVILQDKKLRNVVYNVYVCSLCLSSLIFLVVWGIWDAVLYGIYIFENKYTFLRNSTARKALFGLQSSTMVITSYMIAALAVDRFLIVAYPVRERKWRTVKGAFGVCVVVWLVGTLSAAVATPFDTHASLNIIHVILIILFVIAYAIPLLIIVTSFGLIIGVSSVRRRSDISPTQRQSLARKLRCLTMISSVSLSFIILWGYWHAYYIAMWSLIIDGNFYRFHVLVHILLHQMCDVVVILNAALNPFLYALTRPHIRQHLKRLILSRRDSSNNQDSFSNTRTESCSIVNEGGGVSFNVQNEVIKNRIKSDIH